MDSLWLSSSLPLSPLWWSVGSRKQLRTLQLPFPLLSGPGYTCCGGNEKGHIRLVGLKALILHCGLSVNDMFALPSAHVRKHEAVG